MRRLICALLGSIALGVIVMGPAAAADTDARAAREREMLHRAQEALRQSQTENGTLAQQKLEAEQKLKAAAEQLASARKSTQSAQASLRTQLQNATAAQEDLTRQLEDARRQIAALTSKEKETATQLAARDSQLKQTQQELDGSKTANTSCEAKNLKLYEYSQELVKRYEHKGVWSSLAQKEPVLGFKQVGIENVVQEYQEKLDSQKIPQTAQH
jgi:cell division septum initiation protein DivIVA